MKASENGLAGDVPTRRAPLHGSGRWRHFSSRQKMAIVKRHLIDGVPASDLYGEHQVLPTQFHQWQRQLLENGAAAVEHKLGKPAGPTLA